MPDGGNSEEEHRAKLHSLELAIFYTVFTLGKISLRIGPGLNINRLKPQIVYDCYKQEWQAMNPVGLSMAAGLETEPLGVLPIRLQFGVRLKHIPSSTRSIGSYMPFSGAITGPEVRVGFSYRL